MRDIMHSLGHGAAQVTYTPGRKIIHFGSPTGTADAQYAADRLRARGFILDSKGEENVG